jgi:hypothetical protein
MTISYGTSTAVRAPNLGLIVVVILNVLLFAIPFVSLWGMGVGATAVLTDLAVAEWPWFAAMGVVDVLAVLWFTR